MSLEDLLKVEITTASKKPEKVIDIPASVVIVTRADIEKYGYQTLAEVLENIPGLYQTDDYLTQNFGVRGFWTVIPQRNIIILVNGVAQTDGLSSGNWLQHINLPVEAIDRIEVVRGPMSVIYGTGAFFGVINIKTNVVESYKPLTLVSASVGSENTHKLFTRLSGKERGFKYSLNASYFHTDGLDVPYTDIGDADTLAGFNVPDGGRTNGQLQNSEKYFNFSGQFDGFSFDSSFTEADKKIIVGLPSIDDGTTQHTRVVRIAFGYQKEFSNKVKIDARFGYFVNRAVYDYKFLFPNFLGIQNDESRAYNAEVNLFLSPSSKLEITSGLNYRKILEIKNEVTAPAIGATLWAVSLAKGESVVTQSLFTQWNYSLSQRLRIVAGLRLEQIPAYTMQLKKGHIETSDYSVVYTDYSYTRAEFIPRLALIYNFDGRNVLKLLYGKAINQPSFFQMAEDVYFPPDPRPNPEPENIRTLELNYVGQYSPEWSVSASVFRNMLDRLIYRTQYVSDDILKSYYANVGKMDTTGVELTLQARPMEQFSFEFSATYQDTKEDKRTDPKTKVEVEVENPPGYSPHFLGYFKAACLIQKNISLALTGNYVGPMGSYYDVTMTDSQGNPTPKRLGRKVDGYFLLGANLRIKKLFKTGLYLDLRGSNLLDQKIYYPTTSNNYLFARKGTVGRGISFLLTLGWKF
ncbi:MAG: TonB-dependent receptor [Candidatus Aminicenantes bacterium]|nr:TonB-dependent receptor [Candidatus Aminicenantes bacterium]